MSASYPDASSSQRLAAHPRHSAWVAASAGSGKTKVLTDRVLNLLLEGSDPERLLCLTFTKAAAAEMANRIRLRLGNWAILSHEDLALSLKDLHGDTVSLEQMERARKLFGLTLDTPGGLKIQTIHSFCQSLLKRFPLEAHVSPFFNVMSEAEQQNLIQKTFYTVMDSPLFHDLALRFSETTFDELNAFILQKRGEFSDKIPPPPSPLPKKPDIPISELSPFLSLFQEGPPSDQERGEALRVFINLSVEEKEKRYGEYLSLFLTQQGEQRARLLTQKLATTYPAFKECLEKEAARLKTWVDQQKAHEVAKTSHFLSLYSQAFLKTYETLKTEESLLDYEDLILKSVALLKNPGCHWVLYKLDGGLDHILLDEAQDTSPSQWKVIRAIAEEFYANAAEDPRNRTLFIVGDSKQSIYSFQGVNPQVFSDMQKDFHDFAKNSEKKWENIELNISFRSTPEILRLVNSVFPAFPQHLPFRKQSPGHVELWPLIPKQDEASLEPWMLPLASLSKDSPQKRLANQIALTIQGWLRGPGPLTRPVTPGDILILVRRRTAFVETLIRALKDHAIPVAGVDRLWLLSGLGVQDLLKIGEFLVFPEDDLTLATILKCPLFNLSEEDLFTLSYNRKSLSLWERLLMEDKFFSTTALLKELLEKADCLTPFGLYNYILGPLEGRKKWQSHLGVDVLDSLDEFLNLCLRFQEDHTPSLQTFLHWVSQEVIELKRDLDQSNQVRVMTIHGAKGLQAPIVFLPDTTQPPVDLPPFGFHEDTLLWLPPTGKDTPLTTALKDELRSAQQHEYWRLLYVALTRAEDALYICGWEGSSQETWYTRAKAAIETIGIQEGDIWRLSSCAPSMNPAPEYSHPSSFLLPQWLQTLPFPESPPKTLRPSENDEDDYHPSRFGAFGRERGVLIHKLLEILPLTEPVNRLKAALHYLKNEGISLEIAQEMALSAQKVIDTYPDLFGPLSQGEVPVMGYLGGALLSGQIDRIVIEGNTVLIIDFKTHGVVPASFSEVPKTYFRQMELYRTALSQIYPDKSITCALLWTDIPRLDVLPLSLLQTPLSELTPPEETLVG
jgi:ATP-dependent helicase/nuclease subunit A